MYLTFIQILPTNKWLLSWDIVKEIGFIHNMIIDCNMAIADDVVDPLDIMLPESINTKYGILAIQYMFDTIQKNKNIRAVDIIAVINDNELLLESDKIAIIAGISIIADFLQIPKLYNDVLDYLAAQITQTTPETIRTLFGTVG